MVSVPEVRLGIGPTPVVLDPWRVVLPLSVTVGRSDPGKQPEANACSFKWRGEPLPQMYRGNRIRVVLRGVPRFTGVVSTVRTVLADGRLTTEVTCVGSMTLLTQRWTAQQARPAETEEKRFDAILAAGTGTTGTAVAKEFGPPVEPGTEFRIRPQLVDPSTGSRAMLDALREMAASTGAIIEERGDGMVVYRSLRARETPARSAVITRFQVKDGIDWEKPPDPVAGTVRVHYGAEPKDATRAAVQSLDGVDLDTLAETGTWWGVPASGAPPESFGPLWVATAFEEGSGVGWQVATAPDGTVWRRDQGGEWAWSTGGLPGPRTVQASWQAGVESGESRIVLVLPRPTWLRVGLRVNVTSGHGRFDVVCSPDSPWSPHASQVMPSLLFGDAQVRAAEGLWLAPAGAVELVVALTDGHPAVEAEAVMWAVSGG